jgi:transcription antitermination factor NusG
MVQGVQLKSDTDIKTNQKWYVWYTRSRAEKKVSERLIQKGIEVFLPIRKEIKQWSDRKKLVETPLFGGYIFTHISLPQWDTVAYTEGVLNYVRFEGQPAFLKDEQIRQIKALLDLYPEMELNEHPLQKGELVEVIEGPMMGMQGTLVEIEGKNKLAIWIEQLDKVLLVHMPRHYIRSLKRA